MTYEVIDVVSNTPEWDYERTLSIGASDMGAVLGDKAYDNTAFTVYMNKIGARASEFDPVKSYLTHAAEDLVAHVMGMQYPDLGTLRPGFMARSIEYPWLHATLDFWLDQDDGRPIPFQVKTAHPNTRQMWREGVPGMYVAQEDAEMVVAGTDEAYLAVWFWGSDPEDFQLHHMTADPERRQRMIDVSRTFWYDHVLARVPPPPTVFDDLAAMYPGTPGAEIRATAEAYEAYEARLEGSLMERDGKAQKKDADAQLKLFMGDHTELLHPATGKLIHSLRPRADGVRVHRNH